MIRWRAQKERERVSHKHERRHQRESMCQSIKVRAPPTERDTSFARIVNQPHTYAHDVLSITRLSGGRLRIVTCHVVSLVSTH